MPHIAHSALPITRAVVPVAGRGTRLRPLSDLLPKELLPLAGQPALAHILSELTLCGVRSIALITSHDKPSIERYIADGTWAAALPNHLPVPEVVCLRQPSARGLGDAVRIADEWCGPHPFIVALGDNVVSAGNPSLLTRLVTYHSAHRPAATLAVEHVPYERLNLYGIVDPAQPPTAAGFTLRGIVEKPHPTAAPSQWAIAGRYILDGAYLFPILRTLAPSARGEIELSEALHRLIADGLTVAAVPYGPEEVRFDIGNITSYTAASIALALMTAPAEADAVIAHLPSQLQNTLMKWRETNQ